MNLKERIGDTFAVVLVLMLGWGVATVSAANFHNGKITAGVHNEEDRTQRISTISPEGHQLIKASVVNETPSSFQINVKKLANMNVNEEAPTFAVYTSSKAPNQCGDFRKLSMPYKKPSKYEREFNLSEHPEVLKALDKYGCVVMRNIPPKG
jgi:hypothetical protein